MNKMQFLPGRNLGFPMHSRHIELKLALFLNLLRGNAGVAGIQIHVAVLFVKAEHPHGTDDGRWSAPVGGTVQLSPVHELAAGPFLYPPAGAGNVAGIFDETTLLVDHDEHGARCKGVDIGIAATAGQAQVGIEVIADTGGVDVAVLIHLGTAEKTEIDVAALGDAERIVEP